VRTGLRTSLAEADFTGALGHDPRARRFDPAAALLAGGLGLLGLSLAMGQGTAIVAIAVAFAAVLVCVYFFKPRWELMASLLVAVVLIIPIGRFAIPVALPFDMEPYRLVVVGIVLFWIGALLVDRRVLIRASPFDRSVTFLVFAVIASIAANPDRVLPLQETVVKSTTFFLSYVFIFYFLVSVLDTRRAVENVTKALVAGLTVVAFFAIVEQRTQFNVFDRIGQLLPLHFEGEVAAMRYGVVRAVASSSHPIELGALLAMAMPLALALTFVSGRRWWVPTGLLTVGAMAATSRTPILVLATAGLVLLWLRPVDVRRLIPLLVPFIVIIPLALPGSLGTIKAAFFPTGGVIEEASRLGPEADPLLAGGRVRLLRPMLEEASRTPILGQGFATRQTGFFNPLRNAPILDNQWLGLLLELGIAGVLGWAVLLVGAVRLLARTSRLRPGPDGWLAAGFAAAIAAFGVGMFTFDTLAFGQITFVFWFVLGLAASLVLAERREAKSVEPRSLLPR
jgi:polysaccharide biosynthesis protein PslJ